VRSIQQWFVLAWSIWHHHRAALSHRPSFPALNCTDAPQVVGSLTEFAKRDWHQCKPRPRVGVESPAAPLVISRCANQPSERWKLVIGAGGFFHPTLLEGWVDGGIALGLRTSTPACEAKQPGLLLVPRPFNGRVAPVGRSAGNTINFIDSVELADEQGI
jgi:hypothetical protein